jgi:hypothetical protein
VSQKCSCFVFVFLGQTKQLGHSYSPIVELVEWLCALVVFLEIFSFSMNGKCLKAFLSKGGGYYGHPKVQQRSPLGAYFTPRVKFMLYKCQLLSNIFVICRQWL